MGKNHVISKPEHLDTKKHLTSNNSSRYLKVPIDLRTRSYGESIADLNQETTMDHLSLDYISRQFNISADSTQRMLRDDL